MKSAATLRVMAIYIILSKLDSGAAMEPNQFKDVAATVTRKIKDDCPEVKWKDSYATMGQYDVVDVVESDNPLQVEKAAMIIRGYGRAHTETLLATPWKEFVGSL